LVRCPFLTFPFVGLAEGILLHFCIRPVFSTRAYQPPRDACVNTSRLVACRVPPRLLLVANPLLPFIIVFSSCASVPGLFLLTSAFCSPFISGGGAEQKLPPCHFAVRRGKQSGAVLRSLPPFFWPEKPGLGVGRPTTQTRLNCAGRVSVSHIRYRSG